MPTCILVPHSYSSQDTTVNAPFPILPRVKNRAAGFQASFCDWEMMIQLAVQVEPKVKEWDQQLVVCVGKGVEDYCTVSSVGGKQEMSALGLGNVSTLIVLH